MSKTNCRVVVVSVLSVLSVVFGLIVQGVNADDSALLPPTARSGLGDRPIDVGCPPVYVPWKGLFTAGRDMRVVRSKDLNYAGKPRPGAPELLIDGPTFRDAIFHSATHGFVCDSPWFLMGNDVYVKKGYRKKVVDVGRFVQDRKHLFQFIVNASADKALPPAEWDRLYSEQSMTSLVAFQLAGGRADRYLFESWHIGPFSIVPDTQPGTFTHLV